MSLAEKMPADGPLRGLQSSASPSIDNILRLALNGAAAQRSASERSYSDVDFGKAATLLDRATNAIAQLTHRRDELEQAAVARDEYYADKMRQVQEQASEWERRAKVIKAQLNDNETRLADQQTRLETLAHRAEHAEVRAAAAEHQAAEARRQLQLYYDKIVDTFGSLA